MPAKSARPISILLVVSVRLYREGMAAALSLHENLRVDGSVGTVLEAKLAVCELNPAVLIMDVSLEGACNAMRGIREECPDCHILAFGVREDIRTILDYAEAGAEGFLSRNGSMPDLVEAIERTAAGELLCSPRIAAQLLRRAAHSADQKVERGSEVVLTVREQQVFLSLRQGLSNKEIASSLGIAEATVKNHVHHVLEKLQVTSRAQAVAVSGLQARVPTRFPDLPSKLGVVASPESLDLDRSAKGLVGL